MTKFVAPSLGEKSFNCPRCGAFAHQDWFQVAVYKTDDVKLWMPYVFDNIDEEISKLESNNYRGEQNDEITGLQKLREKIEMVLEDDMFVDTNRTDFYEFNLVNLHGSCCLSCKKTSLWMRDRLLYPAESSAPPVNIDLPEPVKSLYEEAGQISGISPPAAAALLRVCVEKIIIDLGGNPKSNLNANIGHLFNDGTLTASVKKACDLVRLYGNEAAHTGEIRLDDTTADVQALFGLINYIGQIQYTDPNALQSFYDQLPKSKQLAIEKRDGK